MSGIEKARCKAIVVKIRNGTLTLEDAKTQYKLSDEMVDYIESMLNENAEG